MPALKAKVGAPCDTYSVGKVVDAEWAGAVSAKAWVDDVDDVDDVGDVGEAGEVDEVNAGGTGADVMPSLYRAPLIP